MKPLSTSLPVLAGVCALSVSLSLSAQTQDQIMIHNFYHPDAQSTALQISPAVYTADRDQNMLMIELLANPVLHYSILRAKSQQSEEASPPSVNDEASLWIREVGNPSLR